MQAPRPASSVRRDEVAELAARALDGGVHLAGRNVRTVGEELEVVDDALPSKPGAGCAAAARACPRHGTGPSGSLSSAWLAIFADSRISFIRTRYRS